MSGFNNFNSEYVQFHILDKYTPNNPFLLKCLYFSISKIQGFYFFLKNILWLYSLLLRKQNMETK